MNWTENWYDYTGTISDMLMAAAALVAAYHVKGWLKERRYQSISNFASAMKDVDKSLLTYYLDVKKGSGENDNDFLIIALSMSCFEETDREIDIMTSTLSKSLSEKIKRGYEQFKHNHSNHWLEISRNTQDPDYEPTSYKHFKETLRETLI